MIPAWAASLFKCPSSFMILLKQMRKELDKFLSDHAQPFATALQRLLERSLVSSQRLVREVRSFYRR